MAETMQHLSALADEIGPRPATSEAESRAASYIESVFIARGLEPEMQEFDAPRTYSWAFVIYHVLSIAAAVCAWPTLLEGKLLWPSFGVSALVAFVLWSDLDTRWGLTRILPKGPSQNVIARHIPKQRRGEKLKKVVIVAHYDTARASLAFAPGVVAQFPLTFALMKASTFAIPVVLLVMGLPLPGPVEIHTYLWWLSLVFGAYLLVPLFVNLQRELGMPFVDGANDNASGVTAMLGVLHNLVTEPAAGHFVTSQFPAVRRGPEAAVQAGVVPVGSLLNYTPAGGRDPATALPDDFQWAEPEEQMDRQPSRGQSSLLEFDTLDFGVVPEAAAPEREAIPPRPIEPQAPPVSAPEPPRERARETIHRERPPLEDSSASMPVGEAPLPGGGGIEPTQMVDAPERGARTKRAGGFLGGFGKRKKREDDADVKGWLGVDDGFDARKAGQERLVPGIGGQPGRYCHAQHYPGGEDGRNHGGGAPHGAGNAVCAPGAEPASSAASAIA